MFRFWVAGAAFFSLVLSCVGAETFDQGVLNGTNASMIAGATFESPIVTPTHNAATHFSGWTGLGPEGATSQGLSVPAISPAMRSSLPASGSLAVSNVGVPVSNDPLLWTDARRAVTAYMNPMRGPIATGFISVSSTSASVPMFRSYTVPPTAY